MSTDQGTTSFASAILGQLDFVIPSLSAACFTSRLALKPQQLLNGLQNPEMQCSWQQPPLSLSKTRIVSRSLSSDSFISSVRVPLFDSNLCCPTGIPFLSCTNLLISRIFPVHCRRILPPKMTLLDGKDGIGPVRDFKEISLWENNASKIESRSILNAEGKSRWMIFSMCPIDPNICRRFCSSCLRHAEAMAVGALAHSFGHSGFTKVQPLDGTFWLSLK
mmetsp:Transcript_16406/g.26633  ORF Transcript_16406/g.26633 Transcript_16406/m.26633 type:complete len:220 (+) Transcript_16406:427-1086(+)